jgi:hypothetical protein
MGCQSRLLVADFSGTTPAPVVRGIWVERMRQFASLPEADNVQSAVLFCRPIGRQGEASSMSHMCPEHVKTIIVNILENEENSRPNGKVTALIYYLINAHDC